MISDKQPSHYKNRTVTTQTEEESSSKQLSSFFLFKMYVPNNYGMREITSMCVWESGCGGQGQGAG